MTKADLIDIVYDRHGGLTRDEAALVVEAILGTLKSTLLGGRRVKIKNFGVFDVIPRAGRMGVNPASGDRIFIPPHRGLAFRPSHRLKEAVARREARLRRG